ncbi:hypothetical protein SXCC_00877 [Gluconacetobacter sp. SXCC-1]|nr:hypothetical protein SXCC_00877 [Gluconacetobacter sp. SXCC-1]
MSEDGMFFRRKSDAPCNANSFIYTDKEFHNYYNKFLL